MPIFVFLLAGWASSFKPLPMYGDMHVCAVPHARERGLIGKRIEITNVSNGHESICTIIGNGPFVPPRILDVSPSVRDELGMDGIADVLIYRIVGYLPHCKLEPRPQTCTARPPRLCLLRLPRPALLRCGR